MGVTFYIGFNTVQLVIAQIRLGMGLYWQFVILLLRKILNHVGTPKQLGMVLSRYPQLTILI